MNLHKATLLFLVLLCYNNIVVGQAPNTYQTKQRDTVEEKSQLRVGLRYTSDYYYMGRADSVAAPYLTPSVSYFHKSGLYVHSSLSYLTSKEQQRVDLITLSAGYDYYHKNLATGISLSHYFFSDESYVVQAEMTSYLNAYIAYDFNIFTAYTDVSIGVSNATDFFWSAELDRTFYAIRNHLLIIPAISMNAGSQHFYDSYYAYRTTQGGGSMGYGKGKGGSGTTTTQSQQIVESTDFKILDYEAGLQVAYKVGKTRFFINTRWLFPVNPATLITDSGTTKETLTNGFYWSSGVRVTF